MITELYINDYKMDLEDDVDFPLTYRIADAKEPEKRKRNASKTIKLKGTTTNNKFFSSAYDLHISDVYGDQVGFDFDPTLRYPCRVTRRGKEIFRGSARLVKVVQKDGVNDFHVSLFSTFADLFQSLGDRTVAELGWSEYDHSLTVANIQSSWAAAVGSSYWYPLIDYGYTTDLIYYKTNELRPFVYIAEIIDKCFEVADLTITSAWKSTNRVKSIVWGSGGGDPILLTSAQISDRQANYTGDGSQLYNLYYPNYVGGTVNQTQWGPISAVIPFSDNSIVTMTLVTDTLAQFDESTGELVVFNSGSYRVHISGIFPISWTFPATAGTKDIEIIVTLRLFKNAAYIGAEQHIITASANSGTSNLTFDLLQELELDSTDIVTADLHMYAYAFVGGGPYGTAGTVTVDLNNTLDFDFYAINSELVDGDTVELSRWLPNMKASDFMRDMITLFNLYMTDPDPDGDVTLEPIDSFYFETDDVDQWSDKLDRGRPIEIEAATNIEGKTYNFRWADDRDYYKGKYHDMNGHSYGDHAYNVPSTFKKGEKIYQLKIAQSCPVQIDGTTLIIPRIITLDESTQVSSPFKGKPRMFFNNGTVSGVEWYLQNSDTGAYTYNTTYPQAHHLDDLTTPTFDLNFGIPVKVFYTATAYTTINNFTEYHQQFVRELTGRDSKLLNAFFKLDEDDLYDDFMRRLCNIDGVLYRKNEVIDYLANKSEVTRVELIKIVAANSRATYEQNKPDLPFGPLVGGSGGDDTPSTGNEDIVNEKSIYIFDSSGGDIVVTGDSDSLRTGKRFSIKKTTAAGKVTFQPTGGATGSSVDGDTELIIVGENDSADIYFDGSVFKVV